MKETSQLAVSIEAVHKASVIVDDIIDGDSLRRSEQCMHNEFGEYKTILFGVSMLAQGIQHANNILSTKGNDKLHMMTINLLCQTVNEMCHGAILELSANVHERTSLRHVQEIINSQTIKLIENSLFIGFLNQGTGTDVQAETVNMIGRKCGYIFQVMNDLEAFCNPEYIMKHKGNINSDFLRSRKSIVLPYLYQACNRKDKKKLLALLDSGELSFQMAKILFDQYEIKKIALKELHDVYSAILFFLAKLKPTVHNNQWCDVFESYLEHTKTKYQKILNAEQG